MIKYNTRNRIKSISHARIHFFSHSVTHLRTIPKTLSYIAATLFLMIRFLRLFEQVELEMAEDMATAITVVDMVAADIVESVTVIVAMVAMAMVREPK